MNKRTEVLWRVAELYTELVDPLNGPSGIRGTGEAEGFMPSTYTPTVKEYERLVKLLRDDRSLPLMRLPDGTKVSARSCWWHLEHWHHRAQRMVRQEPKTVAGKKGRRRQLLNADGTPALTARLVWRRDPKAVEARALRAIEWVADCWGLPTEPFLPSAVTEPLKAAA